MKNKRISPLQKVILLAGLRVQTEEQAGVFNRCQFHPWEQNADCTRQSRAPQAAIATLPQPPEATLPKPLTNASTEMQQQPEPLNGLTPEGEKEKRARKGGAGCPAVPSGHTGTSDGNMEGITAVTEMKLINLLTGWGNSGARRWTPDTLVDVYLCNL